jgi:hypothetical protein
LAQSAPSIGSDLHVIFGRYNVTDGFKDRTFQTAWGNTWFANGLGVHGEIHHMNREENATFFSAGLSYNTPAYSIKGIAGTSSSNELILPETYGRIEASFRSDPQSGWIVTPSATYRGYRAGIDEGSVELNVSKYVPVAADASLIFQALGRATFIQPGDNFAPSYGGGVSYAVYKKFSIGVLVEGGRASYDAIIGRGSVDEPYVSIRPSASLYITDKLELTASGEFTDRTSYRVDGGFVGVKMYFD